jgi:hypothetical protein
MSFSLNEPVRSIEQPSPEAGQVIQKVILMLIVGALAGVAAKFSDTIPSNDSTWLLFNYLGDITTRLGIWVFIAALIAAWSINPRIAALKVFAFFSGLLLTYYLYSMVLFGFFPTYYFLSWSMIALFSPVAAYLVWFSRGQGWIAALAAGAPIAVLLSQGYPFIYTLSIVAAFDLLAAAALFIILPNGGQQYYKTALAAVLGAFLITNLRILPYHINFL